MADEGQIPEPVAVPKPPDAAPVAPPVQTQVVKTFDEAYVRDLRAENKERRIKVDELQKALDESNAKLNSATAKLKDASFEAAFSQSLGEYNPLYPDLVMSKIDRTKIDLDDSGAVKDRKQISEQLAEIAKQYPALFGSAQPTSPKIDAGAKGSNDQRGININAGLRAMLQQ